MKKFNSLDDLSSLIPKDYKSIPQVEVESNTPKQHLEAGTPVIIIKGFIILSKTDLELEEVLRIMRLDQIISILKSHGHTVLEVIIKGFKWI